MQTFLVRLLCPFILLSGSWASLYPQQSQRPNILFIAVDDLRPELGTYGNPMVHTPRIDRLAASGAVFDRAYVQMAVCNPSRASMLTGLRPDSLRVWDLQTRLRDTLPDAVTLPQYFKQNGYHTVGIGKIYHNTIPDPLSWSEPKLHIDGYPFDPDAVYRDPVNVAIQERRKEEIIKAGQADRYVDHLGQWYLKASATEIVDLPDSVYYDGIQTDVAIRKLHELRSRNQPFFFAVGYYRPHLPFNAPRKYWDLYQRDSIPLASNPFVPNGAPPMAINNMRELRGYTDFRSAPHPLDGSLTSDNARLLKHGYYATVSYVDAQVGRLLDALDSLDLQDNTIVVLWGDHGYKLGEHNSWAKMTNYEIDTRVPLIVRNPRLKPVRLRQLVESLDLFPSLCEMAGLPLPKHLHGRSFVPLLNDPTLPGKPAAFSQFLREGIWVAPDGIPYMGYAIRTDRFRYVVWKNWETGAFAGRELYDHSTDPDENRNLAGDRAFDEVLRTLEQQMPAHWRSGKK